MGPHPAHAHGGADPGLLSNQLCRPSWGDPDPGDLLLHPASSHPSLPPGPAGHPGEPPLAPGVGSVPAPQCLWAGGCQPADASCPAAGPAGGHGGAAAAHRAGAQRAPGGGPGPAGGRRAEVRPGGPAGSTAAGLAVAQGTAGPLCWRPRPASSQSDSKSSWPSEVSRRLGGQGKEGAELQGLELWPVLQGVPRAGGGPRVARRVLGAHGTALHPTPHAPGLTLGSCGLHSPISRSGAHTLAPQKELLPPQGPRAPPGGPGHLQSSEGR